MVFSCSGSNLISTFISVNLYLGAVFRDGPVYLDGVWFNGFENNVEGKWVAGALGFAPKTKVSSSVVSTTGDLRFGFVDKVCELL